MCSYLCNKAEKKHSHKLSKTYGSKYFNYLPTQYWPAKEKKSKAIIYAKLALIYRSFQISFSESALSLSYLFNRERLEYWECWKILFFVC